jgi:hypothetical protein
MKTLCIFFILLGAQQVLAFEKEDSFLEIREAYLQSNKDYNESKKQVLNEDNNRISDWNSREIVAVRIDASIQEEARDYKVNDEILNEEKAQREDFEQYENAQRAYPVLQEVSLNH